MRKYYGKHWREVVGTFDAETKQDQWGNLAPGLFNTANKYTNRKHCAEVYAITTPKAPKEEKHQKQTERHNNKAPANYWRYKNIKIATSTRNGKCRAEEIIGDQVGGVAGYYVRARSYGGYGFTSEWKYNSREEINALMFDKSGNMIQAIKEDLQRRAHALKIQRAEEAAKVHEFAPDIERLKDRAQMLGGLLSQMVEEYRTKRAGENWGAFYFSHLLQRVADCLEDCEQIAAKCKAKSWRNIKDFLQEEEGNKRRADSLAVVVAEWLKLTPEQRGHDGQEERAIYYGCYKIDAGRVVYDFAALVGRP